MPALPGVIVYGSSPEQAMERVRRLGSEVIADRRMHAEAVPEMVADALTMTVGDGIGCGAQ